MTIQTLLGSDDDSLHAGLGAECYDVVAYFTEGHAVPGNADHTHEHFGVTQANPNWPKFNA